MLGQMMEMPLTIGSLIEHAERHHPHTEIVSVETTGEQTTSNWGAVGQNARKLSSALRKLGIVDGERCATIAWIIREVLTDGSAMVQQGFLYNRNLINNIVLLDAWARI